MSVAEDLHRAAEETGKQRNFVLIALIAVIAIGVYLGSTGIEKDLAERSVAALNDAALPSDRINVAMEGLSAKLTGFANNQQESDDAASVVASVEGVRHVENFLQVRQAPLLTGPAGTPADPEAELLVAAPAAEAEEKAQSDTSSAASDAADNGVSHVRVEWEDGVLTVSGAVSSAAEHRRLQDAVAASYGDARIVDQVRVQPTLPAADWLEGFAMHLPNLRSQAKASMESSAASLQPAAPDQAVYVLAPEPAPSMESVAPPLGSTTGTDAEPTVAMSDAAAPKSAPIRESETTHVQEAASEVGVADTENWLHLRSQMGRIAVSGVLGSEKQRQALANALRVVHAPAVTYSSVRIGDPGRDAA